MSKHASSILSAGLAAAILVLASNGVCAAAPVVSSVLPRVAQSDCAAVELAHAAGSEPRELEPRYEPTPSAPSNSFNDEYVFGLTRGIADSTMHPAAKILIFPMTVPLDLALLPFEVIGGLF